MQMFDSTVVRAHVSTAGAKKGKTTKRNALERSVRVRRVAIQSVSGRDIVSSNELHVLSISPRK
jgi:hypothetical protein